MAPKPVVSVLEHCKISPPPDTKELSLPLTFLDMPWLNYPIVMQTLLLYQVSHPKKHMVETIIPNLKASLSLTLKHFLPLAGNVACPLESEEQPILRYAAGNSVSVTFAESSQDFNYLKGCNERNAGDFYPLLAQLPPSTNEPAYKLFPLLAVQVTIFPDFGISIGFSNRHIVCDGNAIIGFKRAWGSINKFEGDADLNQSGRSLSIFDRGLIKDADGLAEFFWNETKGKTHFEELNLRPDQSVSLNKVRATFVVKHDQIQKLKNLIVQNAPIPVHTSTFTALSSYIWTSVVKARAATGDKGDGDEVEYFIFAVDCRALLKPQVPMNYFGNCIAPCIIKAKHAKLMANDGFLYAAMLLGEAIRKRVHSEEGILKDAKYWMSELESMNPMRVFGIAGSPKLETNEIDFGWGKPEKYEIISTDTGRAFTLNKFHKLEGALEVGMSLSKNEMDAFATIFTDGLSIGLSL